MIDIRSINMQKQYTRIHVDYSIIKETSTKDQNFQYAVMYVLILICAVQIWLF